MAFWSVLLSWLVSSAAIADYAFFCDNKYALEAKENYESEFPRTRPQTKSKFGTVELSGAADEIQSFRLILGDVPPKNWMATIAGCHSVICALGKLLNSTESAHRVLSIKNRTGYTVTLDQVNHKEHMEHSWSVDELRILDRALARLPSTFYFLPTLQFLTRGLPNEKHPKDNNTAAYASPKQRLTESFFRDIYIFMTPHSRAQVFHFEQALSYMKSLITLIFLARTKRVYWNPLNRSF